MLLAPSDAALRLARASPEMPLDPQGKPVFTEPWQVEMFAMTARLEAGGVFSLAEWVEVLAQELYTTGSRHAAADYYGCWMEALTRLLTELSITSRKTLDQLTARWQDAARLTPPGEPVMLPEPVAAKPKRRRSR